MYIHYIILQHLLTVVLLRVSLLVTELVIIS